jgi:hypothetical protein
MLTMGEAAKEAGISKATLSRAIKNGRVSAKRNDKGGYDIDPAELFRVYPRNTATGSDNGSMKRDATPDVTPALHAEIEGLKAQLALMKAPADDLKEQRDGWQKQAEGSQRLLADQRPQRRSWFGLGKAG